MLKFTDYSKNHIFFYSSAPSLLLINLIKRIKPKSLVDLGCGDGVLFYGLKQEGILSKIDYLVGVDLSEQRLKRVKQSTPKVKTLVANVCNLKELKDNQFDLVISQQVIEHVPSDHKMIKEIKRILKKGGYLYISSVIKKRHGWWIYKNNGKTTCEPTHIREYASEREFIQLLEKYNLRVLKTNLTRFKPSIVNAVNRILIKKGVLDENAVRKLYFGSKLFRLASNCLKIPVLGYYIIEVVAVSNNSRQ